MLKVTINLTIEKSSNHSQSKLLYLILKDSKNKHWLLPFKTEIDIYKPKVKRGKLTPPEPVYQNKVNVMNPKVYYIEDWMNDESIDESIEDLIRSPRLNKLDFESIEGCIDFHARLNADTGKFNIDCQPVLSAALSVSGYGIHAYRTNLAN